MKISGQLQAELFKAVVVTIIAGGIVYMGKRFFDKVSEKVTTITDIPSKVVETVVETVNAGVEKVQEVAREGGRTFQQANTPSAQNLLDATKPKYPDPLINDQGMDFRYF